MLTDQQSALYEYLREYMLLNQGKAPTFAEMAEAAGLQSKGSVARLLGALEERGFIRRLSRKARAIEVLDRAPDARERRLRAASQALVDRFGREALSGHVSHVPPDMIRAVQEALR